MTELSEYYGHELVVETCVLGPNLNLAVIRGYAPLDQLADLSAADVYDQVHNPQGTQRDLQAKHAQEATEYALKDTTATEEPRAFPEIILNARDTNVVAVYVDDEEIQFDSSDSMFSEPTVVRVVFRVRAIDWPKPQYSPQISRVDGNHRLSQIPDLTERIEGETYPLVPFALFVGLQADQERRVFRDINANQRKMETAHLDSIQYKLDRDNLLFDAQGRALWIAQQLIKTGRVFDKMVHTGGSKRGVKQAEGAIPPLNLNSLKGAVLATLRDAPELQVNSFKQELIESARESAPGSPQRQELEGNAEVVAVLLERYWTAVKNAYPQAWQDKRNYVLLQAIGLTALSQLGAKVIEQQWSATKLDQADFDLVLAQVASKVPLDKSRFEGIAGLAGAKHVFEKLIEAMDTNAVAFAELKKTLKVDTAQPSLLDVEDDVVDDQAN